MKEWRFKMKQILAVIGVTMMILIPLGISQDEEPEDIEGIWLGTLKIQTMELRLAYNISRNPDGTLSATMDSIDQGAAGIKMDTVSFIDGKIRIEFKAGSAVYEAQLSEDGETLTGTFTQFGANLDLEMKKVDKVPEILRPQNPKKPYPYIEEEVSYKNTEDDILLAGTLTLPREGDPFPAVILISGSGAQDRDENVFQHKPFLVISDHLTRQGIAVLRVDDRGVGGSTGKLSDSTTEDLGRDVLAGIDFLKSRPEIDTKKIGLIGHSEGGIIAPLVASRSDHVAFIVLMAGTGLTGEEILYLQSEAISRAEGVSEEEIAKNLKIQKKIFNILKTETDDDIIKNKLRKFFEDDIKNLSEKEKEALADPELYYEQQLKKIFSPWFRYFLTYDPRPALLKVKCPVLALIGEKDLQVPYKENLAAIGEALKTGGNTDHTLKSLPGLNHLFQTARTGSVSEYAQIPETISPKVLDLISGWILEKIGVSSLNH
jgi:pimeloyl-ACP methyl ester carboxylesterase